MHKGRRKGKRAVGCARFSYPIASIDKGMGREGDAFQFALN